MIHVGANNSTNITLVFGCEGRLQLHEKKAFCIGKDTSHCTGCCGSTSRDFMLRAR